MCVCQRSLEKLVPNPKYFGLGFCLHYSSQRAGPARQTQPNPQVRTGFEQTIHAGVSGYVGFGLQNLRAGSGCNFRPVENSSLHLFVNLNVLKLIENSAQML